MTGEVGILNIGAGDTKLIFDPNNPQDMIRAARIVKDMLRRGYSLLVAIAGTDPVQYQRAYDFDENTFEYIVADLDPLSTKEIPNDEHRNQSGEATNEVAAGENAAPAPAAQETSNANAGPVPSGKPKRRGTKRVPASSTKATAVARTAGG
jgi:hypothetical protein